MAAIIILFITCFGLPSLLTDDLVWQPSWIEPLLYGCWCNLPEPNWCGVSMK